LKVSQTFFIIKFPKINNVSWHSYIDFKHFCIDCVLQSINITIDNIFPFINNPELSIQAYDDGFVRPHNL